MLLALALRMGCLNKKGTPLNRATAGTWRDILGSTFYFEPFKSSRKVRIRIEGIDIYMNFIFYVVEVVYFSFYKKRMRFSQFLLFFHTTWERCMIKDKEFHKTTKQKIKRVQRLYCLYTLNIRCLRWRNNHTN